jgi:hypothetical protein
MAYKMRKIKNTNCYKVYNNVTKRVFAKCTTKEKAKRQLAIIQKKVFGIKTLKKSIKLKN